MTTPKSATEIIAELHDAIEKAGDEYGPRVKVVIHDWIYSALASHTAYLLGKWPETPPTPHGYQREHYTYNDGKRDTIDETRAILESEITELTK